MEVGGGHPLTRLLTLLELLQAYRRLSGGERARRLGVAPRTVRRYVSTLGEIGVPVDAEAGRHGGYRLRPGYKLPPLMLTDDEALAVVLGLLAGRRLGLVAATAAVEGALAKLDRVLPDALRDRIRGTQEAVGLGLTQRSGTELRFDAGVLLALGADELDWAARYLVGLGCRFTVVRPPELRDTLRGLAAEVAAAAAGIPTEGEASVAPTEEGGAPARG